MTTAEFYDGVSRWKPWQCAVIGALLAIWWQIETMALDVILWKLLP